MSVDWTARDAQVSDALLDWAEERARAAGADQLVAHEWPSSEDLGVVLRERGFAPFRASLEMQVPLDDATPEPVWPAGIEVRTVRAGEERAVHAMLGEAFADTHDFRPTPFEEWAAWWGGGRKRLDLWFAADAGGELAGARALRLRARTARPGSAGSSRSRSGAAWRRHGLGRRCSCTVFASSRGSAGTRCRPQRPGRQSRPAPSVSTSPSACGR